MVNLQEVINYITGRNKIGNLSKGVNMAFQIIEKDGKSYRKNINKTGQCKHYPEVRCVCCNPECDHNCSVDDELEEMLENQLIVLL